MPDKKNTKADGKKKKDIPSDEQKGADDKKLSKTEKNKKEEKYKPRAKPELDQQGKAAMNLMKDKQERNPRFRRQEWFRYKRLGDAWRKPRGLHSKMRRHIGYRPNVVSEGYRTPKAARGRHPSGFEEVMVYNLRDMEGLDPKRQAIRIGHSVGYLKRMYIAILAEDMKLRILNFNRQTHDELLDEAKKRGIELPSKDASSKEEPSHARSHAKHATSQEGPK